MIILKTLQQKYGDDNPHVRIIGKKVNDTLISFCEKNHFAYTYRYKEVESLAEKIETGRYPTWDSIDDLFAATIIIPNLNKEPMVIEFIENVFVKNEIKRRGSTFKAPDVFRFDATRIIAQLKPSSNEKQRIHELKFEIQIRTAFEHAWSVATHSLIYKSDKINWNAIRLSAQIKASVEQLDMLISGFSEVDKHIVTHKWPDINYKEQILNFVMESLDNNKIPDELRPKDLTRFAENMFALLKSSKSWPRNDFDIQKSTDFLKDIFETLSIEINSYNLSNFPRSISIFQFCFGVLIDKDKLKLPLKKYIPIITEEFESLFPKMKTISERFCWEKSESQST
jgi:ppGpp synthetase/RelA/SpoT-type nucleotidyltranferase